MRATRSAALVLMLLTSACAVREDSEPRIIPEDQRQNFGEIATGEEAEGVGRIYLLSPAATEEQVQLRSVPRSDTAGPSDLLDSLLSGPNEDEIAAGLGTAIPEELDIVTARTVGTRLTIDINDAFNELSDAGLRRALAQLIATATEIEQVQQVRLRVDGENRSWPTGDGESVDRPLTIYDYSGFLETSQPPFPALPALPTPDSGEEV